MDNENEVVQLAVAGDADAIASLFLSHWGPLRGFFLKRVGNWYLAEDLAAETFIRMLQALPSFTVRPDQFPRWLYTIARNLLIDHHRRIDRRWIIVGLTENLEPDPEALTNLERITDVYLPGGLNEVWLQLPVPYREVLYLRHVRGLSNLEPAQMLGTTEGTIKNRAHRALVRLREKMKEPRRD